MSQNQESIVLTGCLAPESADTPAGTLAPINKEGLDALIATGKANPKAIKTLKCKTVAEGRFRHANYIRNLPAYIVDEPPGLLGDDTAPNPSEASLAALGSCIAVGLHANAVHRGWTISKLELNLEGDLNITAVWGTGDVSEKPVGFTDVRIAVDMECPGVPKAEIEKLVAHVTKWSPVANTFIRPVNLAVTAA
ncbi:OsmC family protein [Methyloferula stellata]|uniref:OsmC family protein n=1 Tax=Methyloferula stellata TaxID=876270 RepID=UPI0003655A68|nr:OsmC family protein [Methyloferula stellata]